MKKINPITKAFRMGIIILCPVDLCFAKDRLLIEFSQLCLRGIRYFYFMSLNSKRPELWAKADAGSCNGAFINSLSQFINKVDYSQRES